MDKTEATSLLKRRAKKGEQRDKRNDLDGRLSEYPDYSGLLLVCDDSESTWREEQRPSIEPLELIKKRRIESW